MQDVVKIAHQSNGGENSWWVECGQEPLFTFVLGGITYAMSPDSARDFADCLSDALDEFGG